MIVGRFHAYPYKLDLASRKILWLGEEAPIELRAHLSLAMKQDITEALLKRWADYEDLGDNTLDGPMFGIPTKPRKPGSAWDSDGHAFLALDLYFSKHNDLLWLGDGYGTPRNRD